MTSDMKRMAFSALAHAAQQRKTPAAPAGTTEIEHLRQRMETQFPLLRDARHARENRETLQRTLIAALARRRYELGFNQTQVADLMGTTQSAVSKIESAAGDIGLSTLLRYGEAIGLPPADLFLFLAGHIPLAVSLPEKDAEQIWDFDDHEDAIED